MLRSVAGIETHEITAGKRDNAPHANQFPPPMPRQSGLSQTPLTEGKVQSSLP